MTKRQNATSFIARTAILLAIALLSQFILLKFVPPGPLNSIVVGIIINLTLFIAVASNNVYSGILIGFLTPVTAFLQGKLAIWFLIPIVGASSAILCIVFALCLKMLPKTKKINYIVGIIVASIVKFLVMYISIKTFVPILLTNFSGKPDKAVALMVSTLTVMWSYPQLISALLGGFLSIFVIKALKSNAKSKYL